jgi:hypothetical protein
MNKPKETTELTNSQRIIQPPYSKSAGGLLIAPIVIIKGETNILIQEQVITPTYFNGDLNFGVKK